MLSKKAIATFAAMATFVSGIAFAMPALANSETPVQANSTVEPAKLSPLDTLKNRVKNSGLLGSEIDELVKYLDNNASKVTGRRNDSENDAVRKYVNDKIVEYRAMHLDVIGLHELADKVRKAGNLQSANKIFYGSKDDRDKAQSAYTKGKAALVKKAKEAGLDSIAKRIEESNYNTLHYLTSMFKYEDRINKEALAKQAQEKEALAKQAQEKEALAKQAEAKGLRFTAKIIRDSKKSNLDLLKNLLAEAEKIKKSESEKAQTPGASGDVLPDKSEDKPADKPGDNPADKPADKPAEKAPSAPSASDSNATQDSSAEHGLAKTESSAKPESSEKPSQTKAVVPSAPKSVNDLKPEVKGKITVGNNNVAKAGASNRVTVHVDNAKFNEELKNKGSVRAYAFIYSTPKLLRGVDGSDFVTVKLGADGVPYFDAQFPADYSGKHTVVLVDEQGNQLAWTDITVANNAVKTNVTTAASNVNALPVTGSSVALAVFAVVAFVAAGFTLRLRKVRI